MTFHRPFNSLFNCAAQSRHAAARRFCTLAALVASMVFSVVAAADEATDKGLEIATKSKARDQGWTDSEGALQMILKNKHGQISTRNMRIKSLEQENDGDKTLTIFDSPNDVKGTAFLSFSHSTVDDEQWLYLPALKRVKRISSRNKTGSFMGSEFAFEDMTSFEVEKYDYRYIGDEVVDGADSFMVENYPKDKYSGYKRRIVWIDKEEYRLRKVEFYDRKDTLLKTLTMKEFTLRKGKFWRPKILNMVNQQSGKSTQMIWNEYELQVGLNDKDFNKNALKRAR